MVYSAEPIPSLVIRNLLINQWNEYSGNIPRPQIIDVNDGTTRLENLNFERNDYVLVSADVPTEEEIPIGTWIYANRTTRISLELSSPRSRQRLYDLVQEIRRIAHANMHSLANYQRVQYNNFMEINDAEFNKWAGKVILTLVNSAILMET